MRLSPVTLEGRHVRLEPLAAAHHAELCAIARPELFRWFAFPVAGAEAMTAFIERALQQMQQGFGLPFAIRRRQDGAMVGSTRLGPIAPAHARAEIGATWLAAEAQRTAINTECKRLLMAHGFEKLCFNRIEFKTDSRNAASRAALTRIGATEEGVFRNHMVMPDGSLRHSVWFSVVHDEWPRVREHLDALLAKPFTKPGVPA